MTKYIVVVGKPDSGKTSAIRRFLEDYANIPYHWKDITIVFSEKKVGNAIARAIGVTSSGDKPNDLSRDIAFLKARNCDVIVCAAHSTTRGSEQQLDVVDLPKQKIPNHKSFRVSATLNVVCKNALTTGNSLFIIDKINLRDRDAAALIEQHL